MYTGVTICSAHKNVSFYEKTDVWVYDMTDEESDLEPEEMNVDEEGETEDGTDESGI